MRFSSALSTASSLEDACHEAMAIARAGLDGITPDLCVLFTSAGYRELERAPVLAQDLCGARTLVGCTGGGIVGGGKEVESRLAVSVTLASLPGVGLHPCLLADGDLPSGDDPPSSWVERIGVAPAAARGFIVLPEPFTSAADRLLSGLDFAYPSAPKIGGIVSGSRSPSGHALFLGRATHRSGALVLGFTGDVTIDTVVAQGCRPFGKVGRITQSENHYLIAVDGKRAIDFLREQFQELDGAAQESARTGQIFLGLGMDPFAANAPGPGDFLIRNLLGFDDKSGMLAVGELLSVGRQVQFHIRDSSASDEDLRAVLSQSLARLHGVGRHAGALLFSCLGRGQALFGEPDHDSRVFEQIVGQVPLGGFFCNGEIGPVHGTTYLHGYTSSFGLFREREPAVEAR